MALSKLEQLYRQVVLDHSAHPRQFNKTIPITHSLELINATCGDLIRVSLHVVDDTIVEATFSGYGCTISKASASMMMENIIGKTLDQAKAQAQGLFQVVQGKETDQDLGDAELLEGVSKFPARIKCATLAWKALEEIIDNKEEYGGYQDE